MGEGVRIPCTFPLDPALEFRNSERGTLGRVGCADQQSKRTRERERGQEIITTVAYSGLVRSENTCLRASQG